KLVERALGRLVRVLGLTRGEPAAEEGRPQAGPAEPLLTPEGIQAFRGKGIARFPVPGPRPGNKPKKAPPQGARPGAGYRRHWGRSPGPLGWSPPGPPLDGKRPFHPARP